VEYVVNLPLSGKFQSVGQIRELILDSERAVAFASEFRRRFIGCEVSGFEPD